MKIVTQGDHIGSRELYDAVLLSAQEAATLRKAEKLLYRILERIGAEAKKHDLEERLQDLTDHEAALEALSDDDPLDSAAAFLSETISFHTEPGTHGEYPIPNSWRPRPRRGS